MRKRYPTASLKPGLVFTEDAFSDEQNIFAHAGVPILEKDIAGLRMWKISEVFSEGKLQEAHVYNAEHEKQVKPGKNKAKQQPGEPERKDEQAIKTHSEYDDLIARLRKIMDIIGKEDDIEPKNVDYLVQRLLQYVREKNTSVVSAIISGKSDSYDFSRAGVNCAILSVIVGQHMKLPPHRLSHLATGALLHDSGMLKIPIEIIKKKSDLTEEESQKIKGHPLISYKTITKMLHYPDDIGLIGLQHHERWDGEGYPRKTKGTEIDILARIVSVVDAFEAMISKKPYRNSMMGYTAVKNLLSDNSRRFDPDVLKVFVKSLGIYPIGSIVVLNNAAIARVIDIHADAPLRPKITILVDEFGKHYAENLGETLDLLNEKRLFIARAVEQHELA
jgi:HD-GYP domain-containing protein (c-di-GMP phosphodiesterase class II)